MSEEPSKTPDAGLADGPGKGIPPPAEPLTQQSIEGPGPDKGKGDATPPPELPTFEGRETLDEAGKLVLDGAVKQMQQTWTAKLQEAAEARKAAAALEEKVTDLELKVGQYEAGYRPSEGLQQPPLPGEGLPPAPGQVPPSEPQQPVDPAIQAILSRYGNPDYITDLPAAQALSMMREVAQTEDDIVAQAVWEDGERVNVAKLKEDWPVYGDYERQIDDLSRAFPGLPKHILFTGVAGPDLIRRAIDSTRKRVTEEISEGQPTYPGPAGKTTTPLSGDDQQKTDKALKSGGDLQTYGDAINERTRPQTE